MVILTQTIKHYLTIASSDHTTDLLLVLEGSDKQYCPVDGAVTSKKAYICHSRGRFLEVLLLELASHMS